MFIVTANQWGDSDLAPSGNGTGVPDKISPLIEELLHISHSTDLAVRITEVQYNQVVSVVHKTHTQKSQIAPTNFLPPSFGWQTSAQ